MNIRIAYTLSVAAAAILSVLQLFLVWISLEVRVPILGSIGGADRYGYDGDGVIVLLVGIMALGFAAYLWLDRSAKAFRLVTIFNGFLGALIMATAVVNLADSQRALGDAEQQVGIDLEALVGIDLGNATSAESGIFVAIASGAVLAVTSVGAWVAQVRGRTDSADID